MYGTWSDNRGNTLSFFDDNTFNAKIINNGESINYAGNYSILLNALTFNFNEGETTIVTEWDIRGNMLYLNWTYDNGSVTALTLYKTSN
jgi:hypothetical protein